MGLDSYNYALIFVKSDIFVKKDIFFSLPLQLLNNEPNGPEQSQHLFTSKIFVLVRTKYNVCSNFQNLEF